MIIYEVHYGEPHGEASHSMGLFANEQLAWKRAGEFALELLDERGYHKAVLRLDKLHLPAVPIIEFWRKPEYHAGEFTPTPCAWLEVWERTVQES